MAVPYRLELPGGLLLEPIPADPESCYLLTGLSGLDGVELRENAEPNPDRDGQIPGPVLRGPRVIVGEVTIVGADRADVAEREQALRAAMRPVSALWPLLVHGRHPGPATLTIDVRPSQPFAAADGDNWTRRLKRCQFAVKAPDPRLLDPVWQTAIVEPPPTEGGGIDFPLTFPLVFDGQAYRGGLVVTAGDDDTWPLLTVHGPITDPVLANSTTEQLIAVTGTIAAGETLEIDPARRVLTHDDGAGGREDWYPHLDRSVSSWWPLVPGANDVALLGDATDTTTRLGLLWRDSYL